MKKNSEVVELLWTFGYPYVSSIDSSDFLYAVFPRLALQKIAYLRFEIFAQRTMTVTLCAP